jgi:hypothetical protein
VTPHRWNALRRYMRRELASYQKMHSNSVFTDERRAMTQAIYVLKDLQDHMNLIVARRRRRKKVT